MINNFYLILTSDDKVKVSDHPDYYDFDMFKDKDGFDCWFDTKEEAENWIRANIKPEYIFPIVDEHSEKMRYFL